MLIAALLATWFLRRLGSVYPEWEMEPVVVDSIVSLFLGGGVTRHSLKSLRARKDIAKVLGLSLVLVLSGCAGLLADQRRLDFRCTGAIKVQLQDREVVVTCGGGPTLYLSGDAVETPGDVTP